MNGILMDHAVKVAQQVLYMISSTITIFTEFRKVPLDVQRLLSPGLSVTAFHSAFIVTLEKDPYSLLYV